LGDLNGDCEVSATDLALLAGNWLRSDCIAPDWCGGADIDTSSAVDSQDLAAQTDNWLVASHAHWRVMPIRSEQEFNLGLVGGEAEQHPHSIARSPSDPNVIYLSHDACQSWKSTDAGNSWRKSLGILLRLTPGQSIEVDPVDPNIVFLNVAAVSNWLQTNLEGLYRSTDGGDHWSLVLQTATNFNSSLHTVYRHNIAADPTSVSGGRAARWYVAYPGNGLYRSENYGGLFNYAASLVGHDTIYGVQTHPSDGNTIYVASSSGLYSSAAKGASLARLGDLPAGQVTSVQVHPTSPNIIYATIKNNGLYKSTNGGANFTLRYMDAVVLDDRVLFYYEAATEEGCNELRVTETPLDSGAIKPHTD
jgi:hypothetical protein